MLAGAGGSECRDSPFFAGGQQFSSVLVLKHVLKSCFDPPNQINIHNVNKIHEALILKAT